MTQKLVTKKELKIVFGVPYSFAYIARLEVAGQFPKRVRLGACRVAWLSEEVQAWILGKVKLTTTDLIRYWTDEAHVCQSYIFRFKGLISAQEAATPPSGQWVTPTEVYKESLAAQRRRLGIISARLLELDPTSAPIVEAPDNP